ncbi:MAG: UDP-2,3-diacylglucosamine diphosphatase [Cytophagaceae bacterium]|jgi:UDP-2,3-diacylglucosamine hydrolase|nr:UDP-2,3-diacylglucosamine diphosphatase [Cytophagaceae bacterium]
MKPYELDIPSGKKVYFLSDFHLGAPSQQESRVRELKIIRFLQAIQPTAHAVFLLGDTFDFWFEYRYVIPKGFVRIQAAIAALTDAGIPVYVFTGNHDLWMFGYLEEELGVSIIKEPTVFTIDSRRYLIGHGDGLGPGDYTYKVLKSIFTNSFFQWVFKMAPPVIGMGIAQYWSRKSRLTNQDDRYMGDKEYLYQYCKTQVESRPVDGFIFGHRHLPLDVPLKKEVRYMNTGDWIRYNTYVTLDETGVNLCTWSNE